MILVSVSAGLSSTSNRSRTSGNSGVRLANLTRLRASSGVIPLLESIRVRAGNFSWLRGGRIGPLTRSPLRRPNLRIWLAETYTSFSLGR